MSTSDCELERIPFEFQGLLNMHRIVHTKSGGQLYFVQAASCERWQLVAAYLSSRQHLKIILFHCLWVPTATPKGGVGLRNV